MEQSRIIIAYIYAFNNSVWKEDISMQISMPRGDMRSVSFSVQDPGQAVFADEFDDIYFTVKK